MTDPVVVLDAGVIDQVTTNREFRWVVHELLETGWTPLIPTVVLAEAITGRPQDAPTNQTINRLGTVVTDQALARQAGILRFGVKRSGVHRVPSGVDAIVAAHAAEAGAGVVFTSDPSDLRHLLAEFPAIRVEKP